MHTTIGTLTLNTNNKFSYTHASNIFFSERPCVYVEYVSTRTSQNHKINMDPNRAMRGFCMRFRCAIFVVPSSKTHIHMTLYPRCTEDIYRCKMSLEECGMMIQMLNRYNPKCRVTCFSYKDKTVPWCPSYASNAIDKHIAFLASELAKDYEEREHEFELSTAS